MSTTASLDAFLRRWLAPPLLDAGYARERRIYRRGNERREVALVEAVAERTPKTLAVFTVQCGLAVPRNRLQESGDAPVAPHGMANARWSAHVMPSSHSALTRFYDTPLLYLWAFDPEDPDDAERVGAELYAGIVDAALPVLQRALDGERDVDALQRGPVVLMGWLDPFPAPRSAAGGGGSPWADGPHWS